MNAFHSQFIFQALFADVDVPGYQLIESGCGHPALIQDSQQANAAHRKAVSGDYSAARRQAYFDTAASDIHEQGDLSVHSNTVFHGKMDESGFFVGFDNIQFDAKPFRNQGGEAFSIFGFAYGTGGDRFETADRVFV
jgi:hypothetical protein